MDGPAFVALMREAIWTAIVIAAPVLVVALAVGLGIGLMQALTSIQELTLTFVPKLLAIGVVLWVSLSFMTQGLVELFQAQLIPIVAGGG
ncbi:flagellar biosynthetic protein FliQ [Paralimibaculum aggregatum]|uniref:Flagellar biosynthetic protein FliQ n=1 Tax=Paralimibaculum aggregatum TaxID=3036245 RepID=A0ABQ6LK45_9RHOB|nr:flagellar biosynthetic protein FliQ [Limibaculum sp. NKW23]GMG83625.1 flagellar biosynthetic protein FliQ [Limibaculum sp. NKW23]